MGKKLKSHMKAEQFRNDHDCDYWRERKRIKKKKKREKKSEKEGEIKIKRERETKSTIVSFFHFRFF